ncbi:MAG: hypothetical protein ABIV10_12150 [Gemmatimonadaceae bacterium]
MESARDVLSTHVRHDLPYSDRLATSAHRPESVVLQVDGTISGVDGLTWLSSRRDAASAAYLVALKKESLEAGWSAAAHARARLAHLRPRRAEVNELGAAYLAALTPGAAAAVQSFRRAGIAVALASEVGAESLFGVATALGVSPDELRAPRLRFDALGAYVGSDLAASDVEVVEDSEWRASTASRRTVWVGTRRTPVFAPHATDAFIAFSGVVARDGRPDAETSVSSFHDLTALLLR